jgi:hypothetical protein
VSCEGFRKAVSESAAFFCLADLGMDWLQPLGGKAECHCNFHFVQSPSLHMLASAHFPAPHCSPPDAEAPTNFFCGVNQLVPFFDRFDIFLRTFLTLKWRTGFASRPLKNFSILLL